MVIAIIVNKLDDLGVPYEKPPFRRASVREPMGGPWEAHLQLRWVWCSGHWDDRAAWESWKRLNACCNNEVGEPSGQPAVIPCVATRVVPLGSSGFLGG